MNFQCAECGGNELRYTDYSRVRAYKIVGIAQDKFELEQIDNPLVEHSIDCLKCGKPVCWDADNAVTPDDIKYKLVAEQQALRGEMRLIRAA